LRRNTDKQKRLNFFSADRSETARFLIDEDADVTVVDSAGQICMTHMITKMGPVVSWNVRFLLMSEWCLPLQQEVLCSFAWLTSWKGQRID